MTKSNALCQAQRLFMALGIVLSVVASSLAAEPLPKVVEVPATRHLKAEELETVSIYQQTSPAVVNISTVALTYDHYLNPIPKQGSASGFLISADGYILTNHHVVEGVQQVEVVTLDGQHFKAKVVGSDPSTDVALLKVATTKPLPYLTLGRSDDLIVGQSVYAIGNPFGLSSTLTVGVISSLNRTLKAPNGRLMDSVIQSDAAINPGNSGGPMLDTEGKVIGINTAIFSPSGTSVGISFATPIDRAVKVAEELKTKGYVTRPYLGILIGLELSPALASRLQIPIPYGLLVSYVAPESPAQKAGVLPGTQRVVIGNQELFLGGDVILKADGKEFKTTSSLMTYVESKKPSDTLLLTIYRRGQVFNLPIFLEKRPLKQ